MKGFVKRLWINLAVGICSTLVAMALIFVFKTPPALHESNVEHEDVIVINSEAPVTIKVYAEDASGITTLIGKDGLVITTAPREKERSYGVTALANPQPYHVSGSAARVMVPETAFIINIYEVERDRGFEWFVVKMVFWVGFLSAFMMHPVLIMSEKRSRRSDE